MPRAKDQKRLSHQPKLVLEASCVPKHTGEGWAAPQGGHGGKGSAQAVPTEQDHRDRAGREEVLWPPGQARTPPWGAPPTCIPSSSQDLQHTGSGEA